MINHNNLEYNVLVAGGHDTGKTTLCKLAGTRVGTEYDLVKKFDSDKTSIKIALYDNYYDSQGNLLTQQQQVDAVILCVDSSSQHSFNMLHSHMTNLSALVPETAILFLVGARDSLSSESVLIKQSCNDFVSAYKNKVEGFYILETYTNSSVNHLMTVVAKKLRSKILLSSNVDKDKLIFNLVQDICTREALWENKTRYYNEFEGCFPQGVLFISQLKQLSQIVHCTQNRYSEKLQFAHELFRGRDPETNRFYKILSELNLNCERSKQNTYEELLLWEVKAKAALNTHVAPVNMPITDTKNLMK